MPSFALCGFARPGFAFDPARYIEWLYRRLLERGVIFSRDKVDSLEEIRIGAFQPDIIFNAAGLGARMLSDVSDQAVVPVRYVSSDGYCESEMPCSGQQIIIRDTLHAFRRIITRTGTQFTYIIPRSDGSVALGGIRDTNNECVFEKTITFTLIVAQRCTRQRGADSRYLRAMSRPGQAHCA